MSIAVIVSASIYPYNPLILAVGVIGLITCSFNLISKKNK